MTPARQLRVGIVGLGTAGQASGILLAKMGHKVTILEQSTQLSPKGAGLLLQPAGQVVLAQLGVLNRLRALGSRVHTLEGHNTQGRCVLLTKYADLHPHLHGIGIHRGALFEALQSRVEEAGIEVVLGAHVSQVSQATQAPCSREQGTVSLHLTRASEHESAGASQRWSDTFDLVLVCDGARSRLRNQLAREFDIVRRAEPYPFGALWCVVHDVDRTFEDTLKQAYEGTSTMLGVLPTGKLHDNEPHTASLFWSLAPGELPRLYAEGIDTWRERAKALAPFATKLIEQVRTFDQLIHASYLDVVCDTPIAGNVVLMGDAAHAMSPQLGLGANMALVDASVLAMCVQQHDSLQAALQAYALARQGATTFYGRASRALTPVFQSDFDALAPLRDALWPLFLGAPFVKQQALMSLVGAKNSLLGWDRALLEKMLALSRDASA
jgi:2-polyprenyl-6-methoxyphenol hydroxylase-like FAD-dependent oxidoreductase